MVTISFFEVQLQIWWPLLGGPTWLHWGHLVVVVLGHRGLLVVFN
jgi:hypothetical protein